MAPIRYHSKHLTNRPYIYIKINGDLFIICISGQIGLHFQDQWIQMYNCTNVGMSTSTYPKMTVVSRTIKFLLSVLEHPVYSSIYKSGIHDKFGIRLNKILNFLNNYWVKTIESMCFFKPIAAKIFHLCPFWLVYPFPTMQFQSYEKHFLKLHIFRRLSQVSSFVTSMTGYSTLKLSLPFYLLQSF